MAVDNQPHDAGATELVRVQDLRVRLRDSEADAVRGVSFSVHSGEIVGLVGESGSGKTLTCRAVLGVLPPGTDVPGGSVRLSGVDITTHDRGDWTAVRGNQVGAVFQDPGSYLNPSVPVGRQLTEVLRTKLRMSRQEAKKRAVELFATVGLRHPGQVYRQLPHELSGGMLQRVLIAIAVSCDPVLLVADEATTALDVTVQAEVLDLLRHLRDDRGLAVLFVSHDLAVIAELCDRVIVCYAGEIVESGPTQEILLNPRHPYTRELVRVALPGLDGHGLEVIPGQPPAPQDDIDGCRFADRCRFRTDACQSAPIPLNTSTGHPVRCIRTEAIESRAAPA